MTDTQVNNAKKMTLIRHCDAYGKAPHIRSRKLFKSYRFALMNDEGLTQKQWNHLAQYLRYDLYKTEDELTKVFNEFIRLPKGREEPATLF
jgi:sarcosine oxidase delta subunit